MAETCLCLKEQRLMNAAKRIKLSLSEFFRESRGDEGAMRDIQAMRSVLSKAAKEAAEEAAVKTECFDLVSALRSVHEILRSMDSLPAGLRYGDLEECQTTVKQVSKDCKKIDAKCKLHVDNFNKETKDCKRKVGDVAGLSKLCVSWMDEAANNSQHMNKEEMIDFPRKFEEIVLELCVDVRLTKFAEGSSKSSEDYVKKVLLQSVLLEDANFKEALTYNVSKFLRERGLGIVEMMHEAFLDVLKETLFEKMHAIGVKAKAK